MNRSQTFRFLSMVIFASLAAASYAADIGLIDRFPITSSGQTPAEQKIAIARKALESGSENVEARNALALAFSRRARETSDPHYYELASDEVNESLRLSPDNFEARKVETWIALGKHEFQRALKLARELNKRRPDDILVYSLLTDACIETGNYEEAERAAQWALDMRPGEISGLTRAAYLRELFGDIPGAVDLMQSAFNKTAPAEVEDRAWILTQFAHLQLHMGNPQIAELALADALRLFPGYHYALGNMVKVRIAQGRLDDAVDVAREFYTAAPHPENLFVVGETLAQSGRNDEASKVFAEFESEALAESNGPDNANRELVFFYADHAGKPTEALTIANKEMERRQDVFTRSAFAWALYSNGKFADAQREMEKALAIGIRDPLLLYHAGMIAMKNGNLSKANHYLRESLKQAQHSSVSGLVRQALELIAKKEF
jgi:tetratricopeptide (TPR) repeat protein